jgi:arylsulfatase A
MKTSLLISCLAGIAIGFSGCQSDPPPQVAQSLPNIVLIYADDLGYGDVQCYNPESKIPTPHLDRLAEEGMRFTDAHSASTVCTPSRYAVMTGRMPFRLNYRGVFTGVEGPCLIDADRLTLPEMLQEAGYRTALFGKWHIGMTFFDREGKPVYETSEARGVELVNHADLTRPTAGGPVDHGFDEFFGTVSCPTTDWLYAYMDGNRIKTLPEGVRDRKDYPDHPWSQDFRAGLIAPDFDPEEVDMVFLEKSLDFMQRQVAERPDQPFYLFHSLQAVHLPSFPSDTMKGKTEAGPHGDFIFQLDHTVGELVKAVEELGLSKNTLIIVTSDNGPEVTSVIHMRDQFDHDGARPWRGVKRDQWEGGHRVPFIAKWPGTIQPGSVSDQTICQTDLMHTFASIVKFDIPDDAAEDSFDLLPVLKGEDTEPVRPFTLHQTQRLELAIRKGPWKYLDHRGSGGNDYSRERMAPLRQPLSDPDAPGQLYHLDDDPGETNNLYSKNPEKVNELKALLEATKASGRSR